MSRPQEIIVNLVLKNEQNFQKQKSGITSQRPQCRDDIEAGNLGHDQNMACHLILLKPGL